MVFAAQEAHLLCAVLGVDVRVFALIGALLITGGVYLLVDGGLRLQRCLTGPGFNARVWTTEFWLYLPSSPGAGLSPNAHWFLRLTGGLAAAMLGWRLVRTATR